MSNVLTSIGVVHAIGSSTTHGQKPTSWTKIPHVYENSELDLDADTIDTTSYDNIKYKSSVPGLIDTSGIMYLTANATEDEDAETVWDRKVDDYEAGNQIWLCIVIPNKKDATFMPIVPIRTGAYNTTLNDKVSIRLKFTIAGDLEFANAPNGLVTN